MWDRLYLIVVGFGFGVAIALIALHFNPPAGKTAASEFTPFADAAPPPRSEDFVAPEPEPPPIPEPQASLRYVTTYWLDATCYHRWSDHPKTNGRYANYDTDLPLQERVIQDWHYTVALNYAMDEFHSSEVRLPDGQLTHKYRLHVPGYNSPTMEPSPHYTGWLADFNGAHWSVPRDRMPAKWRGRIDILFTGCESAARGKASRWGKRFVPVEIWEIVVDK